MIYDEMEDRPSPEDERAEAWEYWHERANKFEAENFRLRAALKRIEKWFGEFPDTGKFWDKEKHEPMSYAAAFGSNGERDFMRGIAREALAPLTTEL